MKKLFTITALFILLPFYSQNGSNKNSVKGNGVIKTETRTTSDYEGISVSGSFTVKLTSGNEGKISITGEDNILDYVITEVEGRNLKIKFKKNSNIRYTKRIEVTVPVEQIKNVTLSGSGSITSATEIKATNFSATQRGSGKINLNIDTQKLDAVLSGSGQLVLNGSTKNFEITLSGSGRIDSGKMNSENVTVQVSGSGKAAVTASHSISAVVSGSGQINYSGNPKIVEEKVSGSGGINKV
ncbi:head GIN domain-containing protein [Flavobacterium sp. H122]|uniref:head GIN domain-containing protein n=1 Tax=Flavobacterium sp. H122 TaxID=2529860 RepID=UPI00145AC0BF|nr:head GIN domain-containing protein [Flavobacterium sp. H122]